MVLYVHRNRRLIRDGKLPNELSPPPLIFPVKHNQYMSVTEAGKVHSLTPKGVSPWRKEATCVTKGKEWVNIKDKPNFALEHPLQPPAKTESLNQSKDLFSVTQCRRGGVFDRRATQ